MIKGIGIDMTDYREIKRLLQEKDNAFLYKTFTKKEINCSKEVSNSIEYLATRFAAKEAVFKAIAHLTKRGTFDFRIIETLNHIDGMPYIVISEEVSILLKEANVDELMISITTESELATVFVLAQSKDY